MSKIGLYTRLADLMAVAFGVYLLILPTAAITVTLATKGGGTLSDKWFLALPVLFLAQNEWRLVRIHHGQEKSTTAWFIVSAELLLMGLILGEQWGWF